MKQGNILIVGKLEIRKTIKHEVFLPSQVAFFNNYLLDPKRPQLAEHPGNKQTAASPATAHPPGHQYPSPGANYGGHPQGMMGYNQPRPPMMRGYGGNGMSV